VFATRRFERGELIMQFDGPVVDRAGLAGLLPQPLV
jgi:hypothetical protein